MPLILPSNSISALGYEVANSLRFDDGSSDYLDKNYASAQTNGSIATFSFWIKRGNLGSRNKIIGAYDGGSAGQYLEFYTDNTIRYHSGSGLNTTNAVFRDPSAWYHIVVLHNTGGASASDQVKIWVNGNLQSLSTNSGATVNSQIGKNSYKTVIGVEESAYNSSFFDGYMAEVVYCDGQSLDPTSFGEFDEDTGIWKPIDVSGLTFGTNGFYLDFENSGSLGADVSGNGNNFTVNNLTSIDQTTDTCTNNYSVLNTLIPSNGTLSNGNLTYASSNSSSNFGYRLSIIGVSSGKWYVECKPTSGANASVIGIRSRSTAEAVSHQLGYYADDYTLYVDGRKMINNSLSSYGVSYTTGDIIGIALDLDNNYLYFSKNGTFMNSGDPESGSSGTGGISITSASSSTSGNYFFGSTNWDSSNNGTWDWNFGNPPFTISSGNSDGNGYGNFEYSVPSGYYALNTKNLAEYG
jgi:hypothetical protein